MYNESHLISFGNYLLKTYGVQFHSSDGKNTPLEIRSVTHADRTAWQDENPIKADSQELPLKLKDRPADLPFATHESMHAVGDTVIIMIGKSCMFTNAKVVKVHFGQGHQSYDIEVKWQHADFVPTATEGKEFTTRLYNVESMHVFRPQDFENAESVPQKESNFIVRLKALVENKLKESGLQAAMMEGIERDDREEMLAVFYFLLGEGAVDALHVGNSVKKYIPKQP